MSSRMNQHKYNPRRVGNIQTEQFRKPDGSLRPNPIDKILGNVRPIIQPWPLPAVVFNKEHPVTDPAPSDVFAAALAKASEPSGDKRSKRHPATITSDRLLEHVRVYAARLTPREVEAFQTVYHALVEVSQGNR